MSKVHWPHASFQAYLKNVYKNLDDIVSFISAMELLWAAIRHQDEPGHHSRETVDQMWQELHLFVHDHPQVMGRFLVWTESNFGGDVDEIWYWERVCLGRSMLDLTWDHPLFADCREEAIEPDYPQELAEMMESVGYGIDPAFPQRIPDNVPESHWWWWAPERTGPDSPPVPK